MVLLMPVLGLLIAGLAIGFGEATDKPAEQRAVLRPGRARPAARERLGLVGRRAAPAGRCARALAYALSLSTFRGGPVFPAMFVGAAAGMAASHLPGLDLIPAAAMGIGAMCTVMLTLPLTSTLLATLLLGADGVQSMPVVIVAVVVAYVVTARLTPPPDPEPQERERRPAKSPTITPMTVTK